MTKPSKFVPRSAWGARPRGATPTTHPIGSTLGVTLHWEGPHMGSFPHSACDDKVRGIEDFHRDTRDWADIAYNALVCPHGYVFEGRGVWTKSAANGSTEDNDNWYAVCGLWGDGDAFTAEAKVGFIEAVQWLRSEGGAGSRVNGHRDHKSTECPGDAVYRWLQNANFSADPTPPPPPITSHTRWALRTTGVHATPGGTKLRDLAPGDSFRVIDGSGHGNDGWIQTTHGNWVLGEDTTRTIFSTFLWNVKAGRSWTAAILPELNDMLTAEKPDTVGLLEAYDAPDLRGMVPGYSYVYQALGFEPETPGYVEEHSECVVLVRDGLEVKAREALEMETSWKGPKVGAMHDPRIIRRVTVAKNGVNCRPIYGHGPFGSTAVAEFDAAMVDQLDALGELGPVMALADWNQDYATVTAKVGVPAGAKVDGGGIDLAVYKSCTKIKGKNLGPHGSDHDAKIWTFGI